MSSHSSTGADTTTVNFVQTGGFQISNNNNYQPGSRHENPVYVMQSGVYRLASPGAVRRPPNGNRPPAVRNPNAHTLDGHFAGQRIYISTDSRNWEPGPTRYMSRSSRKADKTGAEPCSGEGKSKGETSLDPNEKVAPASTDGGASSLVEESSKTVATESPLDEWEDISGVETSDDRTGQ
ncbi:hypothetical protein H1R20_g7136, partial [Candolleomyces eurysporus]